MKPKRVFRALRTGGVALMAMGGAYAAYVYLTLPDVRPLRTTNPASSAFIDLRAREAERAGQTPRRIQRWVTYERISPALTRAVLVAEDEAFFSHAGIDFDELEKAIETNWQQGSLTARGGSTITQQLAKNLYLSPSKNPVRKLRELIIARRLEAELSKRRIFEIYLNIIEWGDGIYGVEAAARHYFKTSAASLGREASALLAAAIINPRLLNPGNPSKRLLRRQRLILGLMRDAEPPPPVQGRPTPGPA